MKKLKQISLVKRLGVVFVALTFIVALVPPVDAAHYRSTMNVSFNPDVFLDPANPIWIGTISGDIDGTMVFWATGPIPPKDLGNPPDFPILPLIEVAFEYFLGGPDRGDGFWPIRIRAHQPAHQ